MSKSEFDEKNYCYRIVLTKEQVNLIKEKEMSFYNINGQTLFPIKDKDIEEETGEYMFIVLFK